MGLILLLAGVAGAAQPGWAETPPPGPLATATSTTSVVPTKTPTPGRGCATVTPRKPWRLVASRPDPSGSEVRVVWSPVGCTTGYRIMISGPGVDRSIDVPGGSTASTTVADLPATAEYRISVTSVGATGDGGVSGTFHLHRSGAATRSELAIDFPDSGPTDPVAPSAAGDGPWVNPVLTWTAPTGVPPASYRIRVTGAGAAAADKVVAGTATSVRLGDAVAAGVAHTVTLTPVLADGSDGPASHLTFGTRPAPRPEQVTGNAPVVQFSPAAEPSEGRVLGYELAFGGLQASKHLFVSASAAPPNSPWIAVDPTFAGVEASAAALPMKHMVAIVRTITTMGRSSWTPARTIAYSEVATTTSSYFAGIGHLSGEQETVPRNGFLTVHGGSADLQVTDLVWSASHHGLEVPVSVTIFGGSGSAAPLVEQQVPVTHLPDGAQDAWRASDIPLPDGWSSIVLRRGGRDVVRWANNGGAPCVDSVSFDDAPTDLPEMWRDAWCPS